MQPGEVDHLGEVLRQGPQRRDQLVDAGRGRDQAGRIVGVVRPGSLSSCKGGVGNLLRRAGVQIWRLAIPSSQVRTWLSPRKARADLQHPSHTSALTSSAAPRSAVRARTKENTTAA